jgi:hypothetical protein
MRNIGIKNVVVSVAAIMTPLFLSACGGGSNGSSSAIPQTQPSVTAQGIVASQIPALIVGASVNLDATSTSGLPVTYTSDTPTTCSVSGSTVQGVSFGTCEIKISQSGNSLFSAAAATRTVVVGIQTINFTLPTLMVGELMPVTATASSNLPVTLTSQTPLVCVTNGYLVNVVGTTSGTCTIQATQAGTNQYAPALPITITTNVQGSSSTVLQGTTPAPTIFPQAGSTYSDPSTTIEGIYHNAQNDFAFIDSANYFDYVGADGTLFGLLQTSGLNWTLDSSSVYYAKTNPMLAVAATGNGTFIPKQSFNVTAQSFTTTPSPLSLSYDDANGIAVSQSSITGNWLINTSTGQIHISIDDNGVLTGNSTDINANNSPVTSHQCILTGTALLADSNTNHNLYNILINSAVLANSGTTCDSSSNSFHGLAAIRYFKATTNTANGLTTRLGMITRASDGEHNALEFIKEQTF